MKRLYLMRHAKPEHGDGKRDFDRELTHQGRIDAEAMAARLIELSPLPGQIFCSEAARALETARIMAAALPKCPTPVPLAGLYTGTADDYLNLIAGKASAPAVIVVAHNPAMEQLAAFFENSNTGMSAGDIVWFDFPIDQWESLNAGLRPLSGGRLHRDSARKAK
ncbi:SixA phosphatase family protein [Sediminispirochaeta smaragdinae]|uniref:Phosphohistidine phosphatase, SixA n=1 Tax=Sediminispirochaeta smaragdinae (strain DSM 11293 / JCM 15392 / SEBR 4228) TaxID=573413 RepID=E1RCR5_SEDSS|nr:histidine phosphatase family protein [Sediminispirochaeta smaragdinae]ADK80145.1 putative phosphohistidine phosphatase, SixA [Sediminispirochaeta smaragdinae DSM 11293]